MLFMQAVQANPLRAFCFFEGEDSKYYHSRLENILDSYALKIKVFTCGGKKNVIHAYELIKSNANYRSIKTFYFIDKDFNLDNEITNNHPNEIFVTEPYSIENYYLYKSSIRKIINIEYLLDDDDELFNTIFTVYTKRLKEFHKATLMLNAICFVIRQIQITRDDISANFSSINLNEIVDISISRVTIKNDYYTHLSSKLNLRKIPLPLDMLKDAKKELNKNPLLKFRGKYEVYFLFKFLQLLRDECNSKASSLFTKNKVKLNISLQNILSELSQYAYTSPNLKNYVLKRMN